MPRALLPLLVLILFPAAAAAQQHVSPLSPVEIRETAPVDLPPAGPVRVELGRARIEPADFFRLSREGRRPDALTLQELEDIRAYVVREMSRGRKWYYAGVGADLATTWIALELGLHEAGIIGHGSKNAVLVVGINAAISVGLERLATWLHKRDPYSLSYAKALKWGGRIRLGVAVWNGAAITAFSR